MYISEILNFNRKYTFLDNTLFLETLLQVRIRHRARQGNLFFLNHLMISANFA